MSKMKLTKEKLKQIINEELLEVYGEPQQAWSSKGQAPLDPEDRFDRMDDLRDKFSTAVATALQKHGLTADDVQRAFSDVFERVTQHGYDMRRP